jgi:ribonuclease HI
MNETVYIFTDGACRGNPGPGGWGVLLQCKGKEKELYGAESETTNNRMELTAAIRGLEALKRPSKVCVVSDSQYLSKGISEWVPAWIQRGWRTAAKKLVKNADLWQCLLLEIKRHEVQWQWVRGHSGHIGNERADRLANKAIDEMLRIIKAS